MGPHGRQRSRGDSRPLKPPRGPLGVVKVKLPLGRRVRRVRPFRSGSRTARPTRRNERKPHLALLSQQQSFQCLKCQKLTPFCRSVPLMIENAGHAQTPSHAPAAPSRARIPSFLQFATPFSAALLPAAARELPVALSGRMSENDVLHFCKRHRYFNGLGAKNCNFCGPPSTLIVKIAAPFQSRLLRQDRISRARFRFPKPLRTRCPALRFHVAEVVDKTFFVQLSYLTM